MTPANSFATLQKGGALIIHESMIDDDRKKSTAGYLMNLNMRIETLGGFDYTGADCRGWMKDAGILKSYVEPLAGPDSMMEGIK